METAEAVCLQAVGRVRCCLLGWLLGQQVWAVLCRNKREVEQMPGTWMRSLHLQLAILAEAVLAAWQAQGVCQLAAAKVRCCLLGWVLGQQMWAVLGRSSRMVRMLGI
jgi:hypothetical protein